MLPIVYSTHRPTIKIKGVDVSDLIKEISVTESLFEPVIRGSFVAFDTASSRLYQVVGGLDGLTRIEFSFHSMNGTTPEKEIQTKDFYIYKYIPGATEGTTNSLSTGYFGTKYIFINESRLVSKYFDDNISDIVVKLCKEVDVTCNATKSISRVKRVLPYDSAFAHIVNLSKQARSFENPKDVDFVFYQDIDLDFYFKPISSFKNKEPKWFYKVIPPTPDITVEAAKYSVLKHSVQEYAPIENALDGMYSSEIISFDTTTGDYYSKTHVFRTENYTKLGSKPVVDVTSEPLFNDIARSGVAVRRYNKQRFLFDCSESESGQDEVGLPDDWVGDRLASMQTLNQIVLNIVVPGNSEMKVGDVLDFRRPMNESMAKDLSTPDIFYSGRYLVSEITHDIILRQGTNPNAATASYTMRVKLVKDSIGEEYA